MTRVLLAGQPGPAELTASRALWRGGDRCHLAWPRPAGARTWSRSIRTWRSTRDPFADPAGFVHDLTALVEREAFDVLVPYGLPAHHAVVHHGDALGTRVATLRPPLASFRRASDKGATAALCRELGIDTPATWTPTTAADVKAVAGSTRGPWVVKPRSGSATGIRIVHEAADLLDAWERVAERSARGAAERFETPLVQELVPGHLHDACALAMEGRPVALTSQVREVMVPVYGGVGASVVTTDNPRVRALAARVLEALAWTGPAQIEFRHDPRDDTYHLIEINPKFWGTLLASIRAGVDFPGLYRDAALGRTPPSPPRYRAGVRQRFDVPRLRTAALQLKALGQRLPSGLRGRDSHGDLDPGDPVPDLLRHLRWWRERHAVREEARVLDRALHGALPPIGLPWQGAHDGWVVAAPPTAQGVSTR